MTASLPAGGAAPTMPAGPPVDDGGSAADRALLLARLAVGVYLLELLLNLARPRLQPNEPTLTILAPRPPISGSVGRLLSLPRAVFWTVLAGIAIGLVIQVVAAARYRGGRRPPAVTWATLAALLGPFALIPLVVLGNYPAVALACVPATAFVLWLLHHAQRFARMRAAVLLAAFGWGALIASGFTRACSGLAFGAINAYATKGVGADLPGLLRAQYRVVDLLVLHLSMVGGLAEAAGVLILLALFRHRVTDVVTGLMLGAAIGLGFAFSESILFIKLFGSLAELNGATPGFEYWIRQSVGLLAGQVTFGAVLGAGLGVAAQLPRGRQRFWVGAAGVLAAIGGTAGNEVLAAWLSRGVHEHVRQGGAFDTLVVSPGLWLLVPAPFLVLAVVLLRSGRRVRGQAAQAAVWAEAGAGAGTVTAQEAPFLADPELRLWSLAGTWRRYGRGTALALNRLQNAQLDLAGWRWQRQRAGQPAEPGQDGEGDELRAKVLRLKEQLAAGPVAVGPVTA
jgi:RsiW-degrading membrane proteinase PrsW (M82 family)